ncbi:SCO1664 family protein [Ornithinimicrobium pratense]|uniref:SCO1664 family protein n=1 Tax=Ornithinimicrobium pratense TaxID=2593973 RepID=A0A5J6V5T7_9MICO|nr:SCO1664 family protein [Ornithinimicrobium pratense]QFG68674.1 SCO1664 family protein [Ornithinimicrobium pratense]
MSADDHPQESTESEALDAAGVSDEEALDLLRSATIEPVGVLTQASNLTLLVDVHDALGTATGHRAVYKPIRGERPLRDFPLGTLAAREVAAYLVSCTGRFEIVPPTVLRDGPLGEGSLQWWVDQDPERLADPSAGLVEVLPPGDLEPGWLPVVTGSDEEGHEVVVAHADDPRLRRMAVLDALLSNADRKAAHLTLDPRGRLRGFDHGLSLHVEDKLRTVLWGWAGQPLAADEMRAVEAVLEGLNGQLGAELAQLLSVPEVEALRARGLALTESGAFPDPPGDRYPLPWPLW